MDGNGSVKSNGIVLIEEGDNEEDREAGPGMPPDEEEAGPEDEEGRFFGGGITSNTADVLNYMDQQDGEAAVSLKKRRVSVLTLTMVFVA